METKNNPTEKELKIKNDQRIIKALKCEEIKYHIGRTDRGASIDLMVKKGSEEYRFFVDAAPVDDEQNEQLIKLFNVF